MRTLRLASLITTFLLASTLEVAFAQTADRERLCRDFFEQNGFTTTLKKHLPAFRLDPDRGIVVDAKAKKYMKTAGIQHWSSEIAHTQQFGDGKTELSILQIDDLGGEPRKFVLSENSPDFSNGFKARMFKYYVEFRNGHCLPTRVTELSPETNSIKIVASYYLCQVGDNQMCAKYPNIEDIKKRFPLEKSSAENTGTLSGGNGNRPPGNR